MLKKLVRRQESSTKCSSTKGGAEGYQVDSKEHKKEAEE
jgi:hypothetical protein